MMVQKGIVVRRERLAGRVAAAAILIATLFTATTATLWTAAVCAEEPARGPAAFQPGDISIGDPVALPFAKPVAPSHAPTPPAAASPSVPAGIPQAPAAAATASPAPNGWLGMAVAESTVPGRWSIVEVVPDGPAAAVGIRPGDDLRSINGLAMASADDVSQALTAIAAGQTVRLAVARADQVRDLAIVAAPRPGVAVARDWQAAADSPPPLAIAPPPTASLPPTTPSVLATPRAMVDAASAPPAVMSPAGPLTPPPSRATMPAAPRGRTALGVRTVAIDPGIQERFRLPQAAGAYVVGVVGDLPASKAGIPPGSVIVALGDRPVRSPQELTQLVASGPTDRPLPVQYVLPGGAEKRAEVMLQSLDQPLEQALLDDGPMQPVAVPTLEPGPASRTARRPSGAAEPEQAELRREVGRLRAWLDGLERRLEQLGR